MKQNKLDCRDTAPLSIKHTVSIEIYRKQRIQHTIEPRKTKGAKQRKRW